MRSILEMLGSCWPTEHCAESPHLSTTVLMFRRYILSSSIPETGGNRRKRFFPSFCSAFRQLETWALSLTRPNFFFPCWSTCCVGHLLRIKSLLSLCETDLSLLSKFLSFGSFDDSHRLEGPGRGAGIVGWGWFWEHCRPERELTTLDPFFFRFRSYVWPRC